MTIREAIIPLIEKGMSKYAIAKDLNVQPIMIDHYLTKDVISPKWRICKAMYDKYGVVIEPYNKDELTVNNEQQLIDFNNSIIEKVTDVKNRLNTDNIYDRGLLDEVIKFLNKL
jgi:predicted transcriptional regulator